MHGVELIHLWTCDLHPRTAERARDVGDVAPVSLERGHDERA